MGRHVDLQFASDARRPIRRAHAVSPLSTAGFEWNNACGASRWEIELNGRQWHLCWQGGGLVANRVLKTASGTSIMPMRVFARPETVADAMAIKRDLAGFSGATL